MLDEIEEALKAGREFAEWMVRAGRCVPADAELVIEKLTRAIDTRGLEKQVRRYGSFERG